MSQNKSTSSSLIKLFSLFFATVILLVLTILCTVYFVPQIADKVRSTTTNSSNSSKIAISTSSSTKSANVSAESFSKFKSFEEFQAYIKNMQTYNTDLIYMMNTTVLEDSMTGSKNLTAPTASGQSGNTNVERYSTTNNQTVGVDEPDFLKTDGRTIYFSDSYMINFEKGYMGGPEYAVNTNLINTLPADDLTILSEIDENGYLLLDNNTLIIITNESVLGFDVSDSKNTKKLWSYKFGENQSYKTARTQNGELFLILNSGLSNITSCDIPVLLSDKNNINMPCVNIYYPENIKTDSVFTVLKLNIKTGEEIAKESIMTQANSYYNDSVIYMSEKNLYITYRNDMDEFALMLDFLNNEGSEIFPNEVYEKINKVASYDISENAKRTELSVIIATYQKALTKDDQLKLETNMQNKLSDYAKRNLRNLTTTSIVRINNSNLKIEAMGQIPGNLLNQFSLDEYNGILRIATTVSDNVTGNRFGNSANSENDIYALDNSLKIVGSLQGLGLTERIYSARFIKNQAYVVTFRQTDPFYVIDLSDYKNPKKSGELKIPGYSGYLHPLSENIILGIGMEGSNVKLSMFDVSDANNPKEVSKFTLNEYGSTVLQDHHAFLYDAEKKLFFLPGYNGAYIFTFDANYNLTLQKAISGYSITRALYVNDNIYVVSNDKIVVFSESTFEKLGEVDIR